MLQSKVIQIPFGAGLNQEIAEALVPAGKLHIASDAWIEKQGSIQQRPGVDTINGRIIGSSQWGPEQSYSFVGTNTVVWTPAGSAALNFQANEQWHVSLYVIFPNPAGSGILLQRINMSQGWYILKTGSHIDVVRQAGVGGNIHRIRFVADVTTWTNIQVVFVSPSIVKLYRNGVEVVGTVLDDTLLPGDNIQQAVAGLTMGGGAPYLIGALSHVNFFEFVPTAGQVLTLYNGGLPGAVYTMPTTILGRIPLEGDLIDKSLRNGMGAAAGVGGGWVMHAPVGVVHKALHVIPDERETVVITDRHVLTRLHDENAWRRVDYAYEANIEKVYRGERSAEGLRQGNATFPAPFDSCVIDKWMFYAWIIIEAPSSRTLYMRFMDLETGAKLEYVRANFGGLEAASISSRKIRCVASHPYVYAVFCHNGDEEIRAFRWNILDISAGYVEMVLGTNVDDPNAWDIMAKPAAITGYDINLAYSWYQIVNDIRIEGTLVKRGTSDWAFTTEDMEPYRGGGGLFAKVVSEYGIDFCSVTEDIYVAYDTVDRGARTIDGFVMDEALGTWAPATELRAIIDQPDAAHSYRLGIAVENNGVRAWVAWEQVNPSYNPLTPRSLNGLWFDRNCRPDDGHKTYHMGLLSRPWIHNGVPYALAFFDETIKESYIVEEPS